MRPGWIVPVPSRARRASAAPRRFSNGVLRGRPPRWIDGSAVPVTLRKITEANRRLGPRAAHHP